MYWVVRSGYIQTHLLWFPCLCPRQHVQGGQGARTLTSIFKKGRPSPRQVPAAPNFLGFVPDALCSLSPQEPPLLPRVLPSWRHWFNLVSVPDIQTLQPETLPFFPTGLLLCPPRDHLSLPIVGSYTCRKDQLVQGQDQIRLKKLGLSLGRKTLPQRQFPSTLCFTGYRKTATVMPVKRQEKNKTYPQSFLGRQHDVIISVEPWCGEKHCCESVGTLPTFSRRRSSWFQRTKFN